MATPKPKLARWKKYVAITALGIVSLGIVGLAAATVLFKRSNNATAGAAPKSKSMEFFTAMTEKDYAKASRLLVRVKPSEKNAEYWSNAGWLQSSLRNYDLAIEAYRSAVSLDSNDALSWHELGEAYFDVGRNNDAISAFQRAIALSPDDGWSYCSLGRVYQRIGDYVKARQAWEAAIRVDPKGVKGTEGMIAASYLLKPPD